jgi:alpha-beta hydrolase superfamily lysophospholipase
MTKMKVILLIAYALFSMTGLTACSSFFYYPSKLTFYQPQRVNLKEEEVFFKSSENDSIHAWWFAAKTKESKGTVIFFHGNAENMTTHFLMLHWLPEAGYNYMVFDYPGYGVSSGNPTQTNTVASGVAAIEWVHKNKDSRPLIIYGQSLGGNIAMRAAEITKGAVPIRNIIIEGSFLSYKGVASRLLRRSWVTWILNPLPYVLVSDEGAPINISNFSPIPILFIHGDADHVVEPVNSEVLFDRAKDPKELWLVKGGQHGDTYFRDSGKYRDLLLSYLDRTNVK